MADKCIVAGGGFTGLYLAIELRKRGEDVSLVSSEFGGLIGSHQDEDFWFDYGGHVYTRQHPILNEIMQEAGAIQHERVAVYLDKHRRIPYPVQDHADLFGVEIKPSLSLLKPPESANLENWAIATFGDKFYQTFFKPFNSRVWTLPPERMASDWIATRVKKPGEEKKDWGPNALFQYAPGHSIIKVLEERAKEAGVKFIRATIVDIDLDKRKIKAYYVASKSCVRISYDCLYWTLPLYILAEKIGLSTSPFLFNRVRTIGIGLRDLFIDDHFHWGYCNLLSPVHRITWLSRYHPDMAPRESDSFLLEIMYRPRHKPLPLFARRKMEWDTTLPHVSHNAIHRKTAVRALYSVGHRFQDIAEYQVKVAVMGDTMGYPIPTIGIRDVVARVKRLLLNRDVVTAGRWGSWGYFNLQHCLTDAQIAAHPDVFNMPREYLYSTFCYEGYK